MNKKILTVLALAALSGAAFAATFEEVDTDKDGIVSAAEAEAAGMDLAAADKNGDGALTPDEFPTE